ncbi:MAG: hypothetical protein JWM11_5132 [Planctomycetaceae bacterium]|nr:hypothetical protein [Planctomycetaceae bacterium]
MSPYFLVLFISMTAGVDPTFEGKKAGDAKELAPGIVFRWCPAGTFMMGSLNLRSARPDTDEVRVNVTLTSGLGTA